MSDFSEKASRFLTFSFDLFGRPILFISSVLSTPVLEKLLSVMVSNKDFLLGVALFIRCFMVLAQPAELSGRIFLTLCALLRIVEGLSLSFLFDDSSVGVFFICALFISAFQALLFFFHCFCFSLNTLLKPSFCSLSSFILDLYALFSAFFISFNCSCFFLV